jgi:hypothetical protein
MRKKREFKVDEKFLLEIGARLWRRPRARESQRGVGPKSAPAR